MIDPNEKPKLLTFGEHVKYNPDSRTVTISPPDEWGHWGAEIPEGRDIPSEGDTLLVYATEGHLRGVQPLGEEPWFYKTEAQRQADMQAYFAKLDEEKAQRWQKGREERERHIAALDPLFQERVRRFEAHGADPASVVPYEIAVLQAAQAFADAGLADEKVMAAFIDTGNQYGAAQALARMLLNARGGDLAATYLIALTPAALTPIAGLAASLGKNAEKEWQAIGRRHKKAKQAMSVSVLLDPAPITEEQVALLKDDAEHAPAGVARQHACERWLGAALRLKGYGDTDAATA